MRSWPRPPRWTQRKTPQRPLMGSVFPMVWLIGRSDGRSWQRHVSSWTRRRPGLEDVAKARETRFQARADKLNAARAAKGQAPRQFRPRARDEAPQPSATTNLTDPDSKPMIGRHGRVQGYNAQLVTTADQIVVAAQVCTDGNDVDQLVPMITKTRQGSAVAARCSASLTHAA
jgi:hypothetical protein